MFLFYNFVKVLWFHPSTLSYFYVPRTISKQSETHIKCADAGLDEEPEFLQWQLSHGMLLLQLGYQDNILLHQSLYCCTQCLVNLTAKLFKYNVYLLNLWKLTQILFILIHFSPNSTKKLPDVAHHSGAVFCGVIEEPRYNRITGTEREDFTNQTACTWIQPALWKCQSYYSKTLRYMQKFQTVINSSYIKV